MIEAILGAALAGNMLMIIAFWVMMKEMRRDLFSMGSKIDEGIENIEVEIPDLDDLRQDILEVMGSMRMPTAGDHVMGMLARWGDAKIAKTMKDMVPGTDRLGDVVHNDGPPSP
jgi:hypothetical protein